MIGQESLIQLDRLRRLMKLIVQSGGGEQRVDESLARRIFVDDQVVRSQRAVESFEPLERLTASPCRFGGGLAVGIFFEQPIERRGGFFRLVRFKLTPTQPAQAANDIRLRISVGRERGE